jgi:Ca2+-binding EF-hand superfamily protein
LAHPHTHTYVSITEEEYSSYKSMYDAMDEDLDGALTVHEMHRLFMTVPLIPEYKEAGIESVELKDIKAFNDEMNESNSNGVTWRDFLKYVYRFKQEEKASKGKKGKKKKKKK